MRPGIDVLLADSAHLVRGRRLALLTNHTGIDRAGRRDVDILLAAGHQVRALFSPEHGFQGTEDREGLPDAVDSASGLPIYSLYPGTRPPNYGMLDSIDVVLIDLQDIGGRYYTYVSTAVQLMREAAKRRKRVFVLDRPNPVGGHRQQGNVRKDTAALQVLVSTLPIPMRHGLTLGELVRLADDAYGIRADLVVIPAAGWRRDMLFAATGLPWVKPSPNMPDLESAMHYPGSCLFEATNLSVGRGTPTAYQVIGAPWLDPPRIVAHLEGAESGDRSALVGVEVTAAEFTPRAPTDAKYDGVPLRGLRLRVTDRATYDPTRLAVALLAALQAVHADSLRLRSAAFDRLAAGPELREGILAGKSPSTIWADWDSALTAFQARSAKYLLY
ncbi:MAG TPA: DUF1343 domain-containing protein [Gemmatimonadales bacterium]